MSYDFMLNSENIVLLMVPKTKVDGFKSTHYYEILWGTPRIKYWSVDNNSVV